MCRSISFALKSGKINEKLTLTHSLVGVDPGVPAQQLQQFIIEAQGEGEAHGDQTDVRENGDDTELEHAGQADHQACEHHTGLPHIPPVHQIHDWTHMWTVRSVTSEDKNSFPAVSLKSTFLILFMAETGMRHITLPRQTF